MRGFLLRTGQRLEKMDIRDFIDTTYSYACNNDHELRRAFMQYIHETKPAAEVMAQASFEVQSASLLDEMDSFRNEMNNRVG